jgi:hypothetical protein
LVSRAIVYLLLGALVLEISIRGNASTPADSQGAFAQLAREPAGHEILGLLGVSLAAYAVWRFVEAVSRTPQGQRVSLWTRAGWCFIGILYVLLCVDVVKLIVGSQPQSRQSPEQHPASFAADVLRFPVGPELLGAVGAAVAVGGTALVVWGAVHDYSKPLRTRQMGRPSRAAVRVTGVVGNAARGIALLLVACSFLASAVSSDPSKAKSLDAALVSFTGAGPGPVLLGLIGAGFLSFCAYSAIEARYRRV